MNIYDKPVDEIIEAIREGLSKTMEQYLGQQVSMNAEVMHDNIANFLHNLFGADPERVQTSVDGSEVRVSFVMPRKVEYEEID